MINIMAEFEKRYFGNPAKTEEICEEIALKFALDPEETKDFVYLNRYEKELPEEIEEEDEDEIS